MVFLQGGRTLKSIIGAKKCDAKGWSVFAGYIIILIGISLMCTYLVKSEQNLKESSKWKFSEHEKQFSNKFLAMGNLIGLVIGMISSIIGIGGATLVIPVLMTFKFPPSVISYTSIYLVVNNKFVSALVAVVAEVLPVDYVLAVGGVVFLSVLIMEFQSQALIKKIGRQSFISILFVLMIVVSLLLVIYNTIVDVIEKNKKNEPILTFKSYCD